MFHKCGVRSMRSTSLPSVVIAAHMSNMGAVQALACLASRIEGLNKELGSQLLISNAVHQAFGNVEGAVSLGEVPVRGYQQPIRVWRLA